MVTGRQRLGVGLRICSDLVATSVVVAAPLFGWPFSTFVAVLSLAIAASNLVVLAVILRAMDFDAQESRNFFVRMIAIGIISAIINWSISVLFSQKIGIACALFVLAASAAVAAGKRRGWGMPAFARRAVTGAARGS